MLLVQLLGNSYSMYLDIIMLEWLTWLIYWKLDHKASCSPNHNFDPPSLDNWFVQVTSVGLIAISNDALLEN